MNPRLSMGRTFACLALLLQFAGCAGMPGTSTDSVAARPNNLDAAFVILGKQIPTIVLQAGLGDGKNVWTAVAEDLARDYTVFAYDRPGHGGSPTSAAPRDPCTIAAELRDLLRSSGQAPPFVLVGHSLGGLYQYAFARLYPDDVMGLVLLDPTHPRHLESMEREVPTLAGLLKGLSNLSFSSTDRREFEAQTTCLNKLDGLPALAVPTRLLVSGRFTAMEKGDFENMVKRLRQDWLRLTGAPQIEVIHAAGHYIQKESPEEVATVVRAVIGSAKGRRSSQP